VVLARQQIRAVTIALGIITVFAGLGVAPDVRAQQRTLKSGQVFTECANCPEMVVVPAGTFMMGSPDDEKDRQRDEGPVHRVEIKQPFALGRFEITLDQFAAFVGDTGHRSEFNCWTRDNNVVQRVFGYRFFQEGDHPVLCVTWPDAKAYAAWLSARTAQAYRLPSEAEWEYAARSGTAGPYPFPGGDDNVCAYGNVFDQATYETLTPRDDMLPFATCNDGYAYTAPVGSFIANRFGLHDMVGNVGEWVEDCWNTGYTGAPDDGSAWTTGRCDRRMVRGSSHLSMLRDVRVAWRGSVNGTSYHNISIGFRVARTIKQ
jgi:formylglycine-generating enzyme required for sulfatase activity